MSTTIGLFNSLTWPMAFTIVGSVVTIAVSLFGFLLKIRSSSRSPFVDADKQLLHDRISEAKDTAQAAASDIEVIKVKAENLQRQLDTHVDDSNRDFATCEAKMEKLQDILIKILQDEKM